MKLFYRHYGEGPPLVILHGLFGQSDNWVSVAMKLARDFSVYIPDQRNHGQSPHGPVHTYQAMAEDLLEFMEELNLGKIMLLGHSMGGKTAMTFATEYPELVEKLVVVDISPRKYPERNIHTQIITRMMTINLERSGTRTAVEEILLQSIPDPRIRMFIIKNLYYRTPGHLAWRLNLDAINQNLDQLFDGINTYRQFNGPTLFIRGGISDYILPEDEVLIRNIFPGAAIKTISGASHWVHADAPEEICKLLSDFLRINCSFLKS
jgi:pimeloyl-ACP methyl ester carboxylesterase